MGQARDRYLFAQNIIANKGGIENIDLAGELAKVQALINIKGLTPQNPPIPQPVIEQPEQGGIMPMQPPEQQQIGMSQTESQTPLI